MEIWLLTTEFPPYSGGGIGSYCEEIAHLVGKNRNHALHVFVSDWSLRETITEKPSAQVTITRLPVLTLCEGLQLNGPPQLAHAFRRGVLDALEQGGAPDVIEAQDYLGIAYYLQMEKLTGNPLLEDIPITVTLHSPEYIVHHHNAAPTHVLPQFWTGMLEQSSIRAADMVWAPSRYVLSKLGDHLQDIESTVIRNPFHIRDAQNHADGEGVYYFGRIQHLKGIEALFRAWRELIAAGVRETLYLVGGDSDFHARGMKMLDYLRKRYADVFESGLVEVVGLLPRHEAIARIARARLVVIPSYYDNFPYAALEAMAQQRVVVMADTVGLSEIVTHGRNGFVFSHADKGALAATLTEVLALVPAARERIGAAARAAAIGYCDPAKVFGQKCAAVAGMKARHVTPANRRLFPFLNVQPIVPPKGGFPGVPRPMTKGLLTVVVPFFNMGRYLADVLDNILATDYPDKEILVLNASSTDMESIRAFFVQKERFSAVPMLRFEHVKDFGLADTRNRGAELANGEFVTFLDPDDFVEPDYYSKAIWCLDRYDNVSAVGCWVQYFEGADGNWITWNAEPPYLLFHNMINTSSMVMKREVFLACGGNDTGMIWGMEDYECLLRMVSSGYGAVALPEPLFRYRVRADSMQRSFTRINDIMTYEFITDRNPEIFRHFSSDIVKLLNANGPGYRHSDPSHASHIP
jgi:glycogen synthase